jgi:Oxidoreductase molybdopterin binding domain
MRSRIRASFWLSIFLSSFAFLAISNLGSKQARAQAPSPTPMTHEEHSAAPGPLKFSYNGKAEEWTAVTLATLPHITITVHNEHAKADQTFSGVPLTTLLTRLGVPDKPRGKDFRLYVVAEGSDGYQVVYSLGEVSPDVHDGTTLVADAMDGKPLGDNGIFQLITTGEKRPARWVRNLVAIRVLSAE